jgi:hypothetical protein
LRRRAAGVRDDRQKESGQHKNYFHKTIIILGIKESMNLTHFFYKLSFIDVQFLRVGKMGELRMNKTQIIADK